jgi:hypothetical protein
MLVTIREELVWANKQRPLARVSTLMYPIRLLSPASKRQLFAIECKGFL